MFVFSGSYLANSDVRRDLILVGSTASLSFALIVWFDGFGLLEHHSALFRVWRLGELLLSLAVTGIVVGFRMVHWQKKTRLRLDVEEALVEVSRRLVTDGADLNAVLAILGAVADADRVYLFQGEDDGLRMSNTHEWCAPGVQSEKDNLQGVAVALFPWWMAVLHRGKELVIKDVDALGPEAEAEKALLQGQQIRAALVVPVNDERGELIGFLGFDDVRRTRTWVDEDVHALRLGSEMIAGYLMRRAAQAQLQAAKHDLECELRERRAVEAARDESLAMFKALLANMHAGILVETVDRRVFDVNPAFLRIFDVEGPSEALIGTDCTRVAEMARRLLKDASGFAERMAECAAAQRTVIGEEIRFADGRIFARDYVPIRTSDGSGTGHLWQYRNVTGQKQHEAQLVAAKEEAEELARLKTSILTSMSHDIRTPLTAILGFTEILRTTVEEHNKSFVEHIFQGARQLYETLNSVLYLAQMEANRVQIQRERIDVVEEARKVVATLAPLAVKKGLRLETTSSCDRIDADLDRACITRILNNLVGNAIKFTDNGSVTVVLSARPDRVVIEVRDTGIGIAEDFLPRLFEEFRQESTGVTRSHEGNGLGLAIAKRLVDMMGGEISVVSKKGAGSAFAVRLPRRLGGEEA